MDASDIRTPEQLMKLLASQYPEQEERIDSSKLRFAVYARKSTKGKNSNDRERQAQSIPDQIEACRKHAFQAGIEIRDEDIIQEKQSAKEPGIRPKFRQMLDDVESGKYDGIITYHPDRLARNMKDAGEIIDMLDKKQIKELRFTTYSFENNPMGKMLLGVSFVMSKQYSDNLSMLVKRGNKTGLQKGHYIGTSLHGYKKDGNQNLYPDGENWNLIQKAFEMRLEGSLQEDIAKYLNTHGYQKWTPKGHKPFNMTKQRVSNFLRKPEYAGVAEYAGSVFLLSDYYDFTPILEVEEYFQINDISELKKRMAASGNIASRTIKADMLRGMVLCSECKESMTTGITTKKHKDTGELKEQRYLFRCETAGCKQEGKSCRAKWVLGFIYDFLDAHKFTSRQHYEDYKKEHKASVNETLAELHSEVRSLEAQRREQKRSYKSTKNVITKHPDSAKHYLNELDDIETEILNIEKQIADKKHKISETSESELTYKKYLELFENITSDLKKTHDITLKDEIIRKFFLNLTVKAYRPPDAKQTKQWSVTGFELKEPFSKYVNDSEILNGRQTHTSTEPILEALHHLLLNYENIKQKLKRLNTLINDFAYSERASEMRFLL